MIPFSYNLRSLLARRVSTVATVTAIALAVAVLVTLFALAEGIAHALDLSGSDDRLILLRTGAQSETESGIGRDLLQLVRTIPGVVKGADGQPLASGEIVVLVQASRRDGGQSNLPFRGISEAGYALRPGFRIVAGRRFRPGTDEVIVSGAVADRFANMDLGQTLSLGQDRWKVVGSFTTGGTVYDSEIWADAIMVGDAFDRPIYSSILLQAVGQQGASQVAALVADDQRLQAEAHSQRDYFQRQGLTVEILRASATVLILILGVGAAFAGANAMYAAVAARSRELATLRALGFRRWQVMVSMTFEALALAVVGGIAGALVAWPFVDGLATGTMNFTTFSELTFRFRVSGGVLLVALAYAAAVGLVGGFLPARLASRAPIAEGLRQP
ncbi:MAG: ABC transporter permease [Acidobacteriota bacterium]